MASINIIGIIICWAVRPWSTACVQDSHFDPTIGGHLQCQKHWHGVRNIGMVSANYPSGQVENFS